VVEDEAIIASDIRATLKRLGYNVPPAVSSGAEALKAVRNLHPDLALVDIRIRGDMDGIDLATRLRDLDKTPVVYLTSHADEATIARAKATGASGYLLKPFDDRVLRTTIEVALKKSELDRQLLESQQEKAAGRLRAANRDLEGLSHSLAHDLRTPLRAINGFAQILSDTQGDGLDANGQDCLAEIRRSAVRMGGIIDAIGSVARVIRTELRPEPTDLSAIAREVLGQLADLHPARRGEIAVAEGLHADVDPALARLLLHHLLDNAWKFTNPAPAARIEVGAVDRDGTRIFFVRDNGAGFDMKHIDKLFVPFQSLHPPGEHDGTRIGLAISHRIVERHGGRMWAEGVPAVGATFFFVLPEAASSAGSLP
jgi:hypothetical protein